MNDLSQTLKKGMLLIIETGEYSDRDWGGPVRMLVSATKQELVDAYRAEWNKKDFPDGWRDEVNPDDFMPWLIKTKRAEAVEDCTAWHVGSYSTFEP